MSFLFAKRPKSNQDVVRNLCELLHRVEGIQDKKKLFEEIAKNLQTLRISLCGTSETEPHADQVSELSLQIYQSNVLLLLVRNLRKLDFESRKDTGLIFSAMLRRQVASRCPTVDYLMGNTSIFPVLISYYQYTESAFTAGTILRECARHDILNQVLLETSQFWLFFDLVQAPSFDIASDAFSTFKTLLLTHKHRVADFIFKNFDRFFSNFTVLLNSENYVTKRQSLKLLGEILLNRANYSVMTRYLASAENLKLMMILLRDKSKNIQFEAFHVFKLFVANPEKSPEVVEILRRNKSKLLTYLSVFHNDRKNDEQFNDERAFILKQIERL
ncbi:mo25 family protein Pmo25 [Schizosaccharomyces octosporus yFS286]|uniref:Mo25 family protein Pmo25 n=1 Tax=Schizosaccharomyces octosporus (strain yFS286) TaxID=483514 RepID=S9Q0H3_SCHOY|nr:mo25 family protein Pmo25 [Schizosaccharomyces octosporus yFS286]EPX73213.1 mo25 family protein Pmo25 [Schizosaccharomyces octosporus yFS286]